MRMIWHLYTFQYFHLVLNRPYAHNSKIQQMVRNSIEDYAAVFGPLVTMIEYAFIVSHGTKESIIIRFITLGND